MEVTAATWFVAIAGLVLIVLLGGLQLVAVFRPRSAWTIENVYGGSPETTDPTAYFAFNQGYAWVDAIFWAPLQIAGSIGMLLGYRWGFLLALVASVPFWYTAIPVFIWDRRPRLPRKHLHLLGGHLGHVPGLRNSRGCLLLRSTLGSELVRGATFLGRSGNITADRGPDRRRLLRAVGDEEVTQICVVAQGAFDETVDREAVVDVPWMPPEMKEVVRVAFRCPD